MWTSLAGTESLYSGGCAYLPTGCFKISWNINTVINDTAVGTDAFNVKKDWLIRQFVFIIFSLMLQGRVVFSTLFCFCWKLRITKYWQFANFHQNGCVLKIVNNNRIMWNTYYLVIKLCCNKIGQNQYCALCKVFSKQKRLYFVIPIHLHSQIAVL